MRNRFRILTDEMKTSNSSKSLISSENAPSEASEVVYQAGTVSMVGLAVRMFEAKAVVVVDPHAPIPEELIDVLTDLPTFQDNPQIVEYHARPKQVGWTLDGRRLYMKMQGGTARFFVDDED